MRRDEVSPLARRHPPHARARPGVIATLAVVLFAGAVMLRYFSPNRVAGGAEIAGASAEQATPGATVGETQQTPVEPEARSLATANLANTLADAATHPERAPAGIGAGPKHPPASPYTQALVQNLKNLDISHGTLSAEQVGFWKQEYKKLLDAGPDAVPAIREILEQNVNVDFSAVQNGNQLGVRNLREALFDALGQAGGAEANALMADVMRSTVNPEEIAMLAGRLGAAAPGAYSDAIVAAARSALANASLNPNGPFANADMGPLFETLQKFGGPNAVGDFQEAAAKWNYYAPLGLASLPSGAGVPSLAQMAGNADGTPGPSSRLALRLLAQLAPQYPDAMQALINQVGNNGVPDAAWAGISAALGGEVTFYGQGYGDAAVPANGTDPKGYHLAANNQNYRSLNVAGTWTAAQIQQQIALIDQLSAGSPVAAKKLQGVRNALAARLSQ
jgi:hypothetical protein